VYGLADPASMPMFRRILIANRGEIACRVMRTAQRLGVSCVAVFSEADRLCQHVRLADAAVCVGGTASKDSYLRIDRVIDAALSTGAEAIHPGYGFLSENAAFADAVRAAGLTFIGPSGQAMRDMGAKDASKRLMEAAGVPLLPGYHGIDQEFATLEAEALKCGLADGKPVLFKAVLGGGGKGMRIVCSRAELAGAIESARREALSSFGDDRLLVERYLSSARHIEVQVFCDQHGGAVHLFERDCSVQRRHQKVLEEAPAPGVDAKLRHQLGQAAVRAALAVNYEGAGTVEFIADAEDPTNFFFMEMNTRLQVEHPVTEMVSGIDLVEWQLRVAAGEPLPLTQPQLTLSGHAFEARVYAERPEAGFLPGSGTVYHLRTPMIMGDTYVSPATRASAAGHAVRLDTAIVEGDEVSVFYDPMIAKLIVRGADRSSALQLLRRALGQWEIVGLPTNVPFLRRVLDTDAFANAEVHTAFIEQHKAVLLPKAPPPPSAAMLQLAALHWAQASADTLNTVLPASSAWGGHSFTRLGGATGGGGSAAPITLQPLDFDGVPTGDAMHAYLRRTAAAPLGSAALGAFALALAPAPPPAAAKGAKSATGTPPAPPASLEWVEAAIVEWCSPTREFRAFVDGASVRGCAVTRLVGADDAAGRPGMAIDLFVGEQRASVLVQDAAQMAQLVLSSADATAARQAAVHSPMPGKIVRVLVAQGQAVRAGEPLLVLEAMKMEHTLKAPTDVVIGGVHAAEGQVVAQRALLLSFQQEGTASAT